MEFRPTNIKKCMNSFTGVVAKTKRQNGKVLTELSATVTNMYFQCVI